MSIVFTWYSPSPVDITDDVEFEDASFTMSTGSTVGTCQINVKDLDLSYTFKAGHRLTLDIDGVRYWDGFALEVTQRYHLPVIDTNRSGQRVKIWELRGTDIGLLFQRRFVFNQSRPERAYSSGGKPAVFKPLPAGTSDLAYLNLIMTHLTIGSDNLTTDFHAVGSPNPDEDGLAISIGDTWAQAMRLTADLPGAVWGMRPDRVVYYEDDDTETAPFAISDIPDNVTSFGYSSYQWLNDGSRLINDAQIWGVGLGQNHLTYERVEDDASIAAHGRWQNQGGWRTNLYVPAHVEAVAESLVYGSPAHLHGGKDDSIMVRCRVKETGLLPGQKLRIISNVFEDEVVLPIRNVTVTFANRDEALYDIVATWDIDSPRSFFDWPPFPEFPSFPPIIITGHPTCSDLSQPQPDIFFDWGGWSITDQSPPIYGEAIIDFSNAGVNIALRNRKRYGQLTSFVSKFTGQYGDGYGGTEVWVTGVRSFNVSGPFAISFTFTMFPVSAPGVHYSPFPDLAFLGGPSGTQDNLMIPDVTLYIRINGSVFMLVSHGGDIGGSQPGVSYVPGIGSRPAGTPITFQWMSDGQARLVVGGVAQGLAASSSLIDFGESLGLAGMADETTFENTFVVFASLEGSIPNSKFDGGGDIHFFDNDFALSEDGYVINSGADYSPAPEDGCLVGIDIGAITVTFDLPEFDFDSIPVCIDPATQLLAGERFGEALIRTSSTRYVFSMDYMSGTTEIYVDGVKQRLTLDYSESLPSGVIFRVSLPDGAVVYGTCQVPG